jgi:hypothetical protein
MHTRHTQAIDAQVYFWGGGNMHNVDDHPTQEPGCNRKEAEAGGEFEFDRDFLKRPCLMKKDTGEK